MMSGDWKLIHYFEDERSELYHLGNDLEEQFNIAPQHRVRVEAMLGELKKWQESVGATLPTKNPEFDAKAREAQLSTLEEEGNPKREAQHAEFMKPDYVPGRGWWDKPKISKTKD